MFSIIISQQSTGVGQCRNDKVTIYIYRFQGRDITQLITEEKTR